MKRRLTLPRADQSAEVLILDEPTTGLDPRPPLLWDGSILKQKVVTLSSRPTTWMKPSNSATAW